MSLTLQQIVEIKYPGAIEQGLVSFRNPSPYDKVYIDTWAIDNTPRPTEESLLLESDSLERSWQLMDLKKNASLILMQAIDSVAKEKDYDDASSIASYANSGNPKWKAEAEAFIAWRDSVFIYAYTIYDEINNGAPIPDEQQFIDGIPEIQWPILNFNK